MEESTQQKQRPWYFNLWNDGDSAIVRILHTTTDTIESIKSHKVTVNDKNRRVRCLETNCPLCNANNRADDKIYIHLFDYTDNREKVWERTDKIIPQLVTLQQAWTPLHSAVLKITRRGDEFPKYDIEVQNPNLFNTPDMTLIDEPVAKMFSMKRTAEEIEEYIKTGNFPERKPFIPKDTNTSAQTTATPNTVANNVSTPDNIFDPFVDTTIIRPRKV